MITAQQIVDRIRAQSASNEGDALLTGKPNTEVTGIVTAWTPTFDVLRKAVAKKANFVVTLESAYWNRNAPGSGRGPKEEDIANDPTYKLKHAFIADNGIAIYRVRGAWTSRAEDGQLRGLSRALNWDMHYKPAAGAAPWAKGNHLFSLPASSFGDLAGSMKRQLKAHTIRCVGDPKIRVSNVALTHGYLLVPDLAKVLRDASVDVVVCGEPCEWEAGPYFMDLVAAGQKKGMIILGSQVSSEPGCGELATWVRSLVSEVPVEWMPAGEPFQAIG